MLNIPVNNIPYSANKIERQKKVVLICQSGKRSQMALQTLRTDLDLTNVYSLKEGLSQWALIKKHIVKKSSIL